MQYCLAADCRAVTPWTRRRCPYAREDTMLRLAMPRRPSRRPYRRIEWGLGLGLVTVLTAVGGVASAHPADRSQTVAPVVENVGAYDRGSYTSVVYQNDD